MSSMYDRTYLIHNAGVKDASKAKMVEVLKRLILYVDGHGGVHPFGTPENIRAINPTISDDVTFLYLLSCEALGVEPYLTQANGTSKPTNGVIDAPSSKVAEAIIETGRPVT